MPLPGVRTYANADPMMRSSFRSSFFTPEGMAAPFVFEGIIIDHNLSTWTVDVISKFDQKRFFGIQCGSSYFHYNRGEGVYAFPDLGAKCMVCIPGDGSAPFVLSFISPQEAIPDTTSEETPSGVEGNTTRYTGTSTYAGGRVRAKPGDIYMRGRDGNFVVLHRGGVLQIGASELAQRLYIGLENIITDVSQNYEHHNAGGSINWFVNVSESETNPANTWRQTFRILSDQEKATVRVSCGKVTDVIKEDGESGSDLSQLGFSDDTIVCEVLVAPESIHAGTGALESGTKAATKLRYFFDKDGNFMSRMVGTLYLNAKKLRVRLKEDMEVLGKNFTLNFSGTGRIQATSALELVGGVITFNGGKNPVATVGSQVNVTLVPGTTWSMIVPPATAPVVATLVAAPIVTGTVSTGIPTLLG